MNSSGQDVHRTSNNAQDHLHYSGQDVDGVSGFYCDVVDLEETEDASQLVSATDAIETELATERASRLAACLAFEAQRVDSDAGPLDVFRVDDGADNSEVGMDIAVGPEPEAAFDPALLQDMLDMVADGMTVNWPDGINQMTARSFLARRRDG